MKFGTEFSIFHLKICRETKIQYKLIHRVIACNAWLKMIRIKNTPTCQYCSENDDIQKKIFSVQKRMISGNIILAIGGKHQ